MPDAKWFYLPLFFRVNCIGVHSAYVQAIDVKKPDKGALFEIPVTVVIKEPLDVSVPKPVVTYKHVSINH